MSTRKGTLRVQSSRARLPAPNSESRGHLGAGGGAGKGAEKEGWTHMGMGEGDLAALQPANRAAPLRPLGSCLALRP